MGEQGRECEPSALVLLKHTFWLGLCLPYGTAGNGARLQRLPVMTTAGISPVVSAPAAGPLEPLHETRQNLTRAVLNYTKCRISHEELWGELDWAAACYDKAGFANKAAATRAHYVELVAR